MFISDFLERICGMLESASDMSNSSGTAEVLGRQKLALIANPKACCRSLSGPSGIPGPISCGYHHNGNGNAEIKFSQHIIFTRQR